MANVLRQLGVVPLTASFTTIYTVPVATTFSVGMFHLANVTGSAVTVRICLVPNAGSPVIGNSMLWDFQIAPNDVIELLKGDQWPAQYSLQALGSTLNAVNLKLAGVETA